MMVTIRFRLDHELVKEIDKWVEKGRYKSREEFIIEAVKEALARLNKKN